MDSGSGILKHDKGSYHGRGRTSQGGPSGDFRRKFQQLKKQLGSAAVIDVYEYINPAAADTDAFLLAKATSTAIQTHTVMDGVAAAGLSIPRNVSVTTTGVDGSFNFPLSVTIYGKLNGKPQSEVITVASGESPGTKQGTKPFDKITKVVISANVDGAGTVSVGFGPSLGVYNTPVARAGLVSPIREIVNGTAVTTGVLTASGLYTPASAPNGTSDYAIYCEVDVSDVLSNAPTGHRLDHLGLLLVQREAVHLLLRHLLLFGALRFVQKMPGVPGQIGREDGCRGALGRGGRALRRLGEGDGRGARRLQGRAKRPLLEAGEHGVPRLSARSRLCRPR